MSNSTSTACAATQPNLFWRVARRLYHGVRRRLPTWRHHKPHYEDWLQDRLAARLIEFADVEPTVFFSILTPVHDPSPHFLDALTACVLDQDYPEFEWVVVNNGCQHGAVRRRLAWLERQARVRLVRAERNLGIVGGTRLALEQARGDYAVPVDHDDLLYPDALRVLAHYIQRHEEPAILYSDEDKLICGRADCPYFKPDWDPALFLNCCYVTHLTAFARELALELDAYTDPDAEGCPDWDLYCRFVRAARTPVHVPEVLYSWRIHERSTSSLEAGAKAYATACQEKVIRKHLAALDHADQIDLRPNPLFKHPGMWWPTRRRGNEPAIQVNLVLGEDDDVGPIVRCLEETGYPRLRLHLIGPNVGTPRFSGLEVHPWFGRYSEWLAQAAAEVPTDQIMLTLHGDCTLTGDDWPWEIAGLFERHDDVAAVCGQLRDVDGKLERAGEAFGYTGLFGSPAASPWHDPSGYHGVRNCQRTVSVVTPHIFAARVGFLATALRALPVWPTWEMLGAWLGAQAHERGLRVLYSPHVVAQRRVPPPLLAPFSDEEVLLFLKQHGDLLTNDAYYGRFHSLKEEEGYQLTTEAARRAVLSTWFSRLVGYSPGESPHDPVPRLDPKPARRPAVAVHG
jgi:hypothetical protein